VASFSERVSAAIGCRLRGNDGLLGVAPPRRRPPTDVFNVRAFGVAAVVLTSGKCAVEHVHVCARHLLGGVVVAPTEVAGFQQPIDRLGGGAAMKMF
jgi:hypothetical protein